MNLEENLCTPWLFSVSSLSGTAALAGSGLKQMVLMVVVYSFAVMGSKMFAGTYGGGVYLSANNGTSWTPVNNGLTNYFVYALATAGINLYAGTCGGGAFVSTNNGTSWPRAVQRFLREQRMPATGNG